MLLINNVIFGPFIISTIIIFMENFCFYIYCLAVSYYYICSYISNIYVQNLVAMQWFWLNSFSFFQIQKKLLRITMNKENLALINCTMHRSMNSSGHQTLIAKILIIFFLFSEMRYFILISLINCVRAFDIKSSFH